MRWISLISSGHSIQMQRNTPSSQVHMEHSPGWSISWVTSQTSVNLRKLKSLSSIFSDHNTIRLDINYKKEKKNCKKHKHMEIKHVSKSPAGDWRDQREIKKFLETNDNESTATQYLWAVAKAVLRRKFIAMQSYLKKQEKHRVDNLTLHLKQLKKRTKKK